MIERDNKYEELEILKAKTVTQMWVEELDCLRQEYVEYIDLKTEKLPSIKILEKGKKKKVKKSKNDAVEEE